MENQTMKGIFVSYEGASVGNMLAYLCYPYHSTLSEIDIPQNYSTTHATARVEPKYREAPHNG